MTYVDIEFSQHSTPSSLIVHVLMKQDWTEGVVGGLVNVEHVYV